MPGPPEEIAVVREIYSLLLRDRLNESTIANILNQRGQKRDVTHPWTRGTEHEVLTNEKYIGNNVYNKESFKLKKRRVLNPGHVGSLHQSFRARHQCR